MPRIPRIVMKGTEGIYHIISRTALDGFVLGDSEKEELLRIIKHMSSVYFTEVHGFCLMGNHFHLLVKMKTSDEYSDQQIRARFELYYDKNPKRQLTDGQIPFYRNKWESLSEYVKEIKQTFSRHYNRKSDRKGFFWSERFKSVLVENGDTLINCLAYIDLNPVRAGITILPEDYRWSSLGYYVQTGNNDEFLSMDFGLKALMNATVKERFVYYREFIYEKGGMERPKGRQISPEILEKERKKGFRMSKLDRFKYRTRYFSDSAIIGSKGFVADYYQMFKSHFSSIHEKKPRIISGLEGIYSLKRLSEKV